MPFYLASLAWQLVVGSLVSALDVALSLKAVLPPVALPPWGMGWGKHDCFGHLLVAFQGVSSPPSKDTGCSRAQVAQGHLEQLWSQA